MSLPDAWGLAFSQSNRRWLNHGWMRDNAALKTCLEPKNCPMARRKNKCISQRCILRYPEERDLEVLR